jgi:hypothetical protein
MEYRNNFLQYFRDCIGMMEQLFEVGKCSPIPLLYTAFGIGIAADK